MTLAGRRYIVCRNHEEAKKDAADRAAILAALERQLKKGDKALVGNSGYRRFLATAGEDHFVIDRAKAEEDARFDGVFVLRTNTELAPLDAMLCYKQLWTVERTFRTAKSLFATRPIFHKLDETIRGHVLMCSRDCSWFGRMADWCEQDLRRLRVRTAVAFHDSCSSRESVVAAARIAA